MESHIITMNGKVKEFSTLEDATKFASQVFEESGIVLGIEKIPPIKVSRQAYNAIHSDYKGEIDGKKSVFNGSLRHAAGLEGWGGLNGTALLIEGKDFEII